MSIFQEDRKILRELAARYAEIAALDIQKTNINNWRALYDRKPVKPMFSIDQICWKELDSEEELILRCSDPFARELENNLIMTLYRWKYFPCDMVVKPYYALKKIVSNSGIGISKVRQDESEHVGAQSHLYEDGIPDEEALEKLHVPEIIYEKETSEKAKACVEEYYGDILPVRLTGSLMWEALWDRIVFWRGAEVVLYDLLDRPEFLHAIMKKLVAIEMDTIDLYEKLNLFEADGAQCHYLETYCNDLPKPGFDPEHVRAADCWVAGAAQIFSEVSPAMHEEFEIEYMKPLYERFGLVNYGCCEPLHNKIDIVKKIKNVRTISVSPWANVDIAAEKMGSDYVMARKPSPSYVAFDQMNDEVIRQEIRGTLSACKRNNTPVVLVLKDITTIRNQPNRLAKWHEIAKQELDQC